MEKKRIQPKNIVIIALVCVVAVTLVLVVPVPSRVNFSQPGFRIQRDSNMAEKPITMAVKGWRWHSLLGYNNLRATVEVTVEDEDSPFYGESYAYNLYQSSGYNGNLLKLQDICMAQLWWHVPTVNVTAHRSLYMSEKLDTFMATNNRYYYDYFDMASTDSTKTGRDIWDGFNETIHLDFA